MKTANISDLEQELWVRTQRDDLAWVTKQGEVIPIKEMTDKHLMNAIKLLRRREEEFMEVIGDMDPMDYYD